MDAGSSGVIEPDRQTIFTGVFSGSAKAFLRLYFPFG